MCNLYRLAQDRENIARFFSARPITDPPQQTRIDIYPKYEAWVVRKQDGERVLDFMPWGIIREMRGKSGKMLKKPVTNARTLDSNFWRSTIAAPAQRCLVPFTAFAEPRPGIDAETRRPNNWWFTIPGTEISAFAGIWRWSEGAPRFTFLTCDPNPLVAPLHPKAMPVILQPEDYDGWLDGEFQNACALAQPFPSQLMQVG